MMNMIVRKTLHLVKKRISRRRKRAKTSSAFNVIRFLSALLNLLRLTYFDEFKIFNVAPFVDLDEDLRDIKGVIDCSSDFSYLMEEYVLWMINHNIFFPKNTFKKKLVVYRSVERYIAFPSTESIQMASDGFFVVTYEKTMPIKSHSVVYTEFGSDKLKSFTSSKGFYGAKLYKQQLEDVGCCSGNFEEKESDGFIWRHRYFHDNFKIIDVNIERAEKKRERAKRFYQKMGKKYFPTCLNLWLKEHYDLEIEHIALQMSVRLEDCKLIDRYPWM